MDFLVLAQCKTISGIESELTAHIKSEPEEDTELEIFNVPQTKSDAQQLLYAYHEIKEEVVVGPTEIHRLTQGNKQMDVLSKLDSPRLLSCRVELQDLRYNDSEVKRFFKFDNNNHLVQDKTYCGYFNDQMSDTKLTDCDYEMKPPVITFSSISSLSAKLPTDEKKPSITKVNDPSLVHKSGVKNYSSFVCDICGKIFEIKSSLAVHIRIHYKKNNKKETNSRPKLLPCNICNKLYAKSYLKIHRYRHFNKSSHTCDICNKTFATKSTLYQHQYIHRCVKPYSCEVCNGQFRQRIDLIRHETVHTGEKQYVCDICCKPFARSNDLAKHKILHTGKKAFSCKICNKTFYRRYRLIDHKCLDGEQKTYTCEICKKEFYSCYGLTRHKKNVTCYKNASLAKVRKAISM